MPRVSRRDQAPSDGGLVPNNVSNSIQVIRYKSSFDTSHSTLNKAFRYNSFDTQPSHSIQVIRYTSSFDTQPSHDDTTHLIARYVSFLSPAEEVRQGLRPVVNRGDYVHPSVRLPALFREE